MENERDLQEAVNKDLRKLGIKFLHLEAGRGSRNRTHRSGFPDLVIFSGGGRSFFVELKWKGGRLRPDQEAFQEWAWASKYDFYVVRSWVEWELVKKENGL